MPVRGNFAFDEEIDKENSYHQHLNAEIDNLYQNVGYGNGQSGEIDFAEYTGITDKSTGISVERRRKIRPYGITGKIE